MIKVYNMAGTVLMTVGTMSTAISATLTAAGYDTFGICCLCTAWSAAGFMVSLGADILEKLTDIDKKLEPKNAEKAPDLDGTKKMLKVLVKMTEPKP